MSLNVTPAYERLVEPFEIQPGVSFRWDLTAGPNQVEVTTASKRPWVIEAEASNGGFYTGTMNQISASLMLKPSSHLAVGVQLERSDVSLAEGDFVAKVFSTRIDLAASTNITWSNQVQYDTDSKVLGFQSRFRWILSRATTCSSSSAAAGTTRPAATSRRSTARRRSCRTPSACRRAGDRGPEGRRSHDKPAPQAGPRRGRLSGADRRVHHVAWRCPVLAQPVPTFSRRFPSAARTAAALPGPGSPRKGTRDSAGGVHHAAKAKMRGLGDALSENIPLAVEWRPSGRRNPEYVADTGDLA